MEPFNAIQTAAAAFGAAALGGLLMAVIRLRGAQRPPSSIAMAHGLLGGAGLTLLIYFACTTGIPAMAQAAAALLAVAAALGVWLNLAYHSRMRALPIPLMLVHALLAMAGLVVLLFVLLPSRGGI